MSSGARPSRSATICASTVSWPWPCTVTSARDRYRAERIDIDGGHGHRAVLGSGALAGLGREQRREIAHVRHARLDHGGKADAVELPAARAASRRAPERVEPAVADRRRHGARIVAGIVKRAGRGAIREAGGGNEVAADHVERVEAELDGDALHQPLQRQIELRPAEAADQARRHLVGEHDAVRHLDIGDVVGAGRPRRACGRAVPASARAERRRSLRAGRAAAPRMRPSLRHRRLDLGDAVRARARGDADARRRSSTHFTGRPAIFARRRRSAPYRETPRA